ncbi:hypothetical protein KBP30_00305 [Streptomyces sp. Go40/10]|uniref:hypothetical protein n=1 Tax=Streptomyces sp. Go40/10 TaxID=2825844 RepID=UPI001E5B15A7|nr:hypothetical protein [Streptomyces sp. Go40/10]UFQ99772.1 hypothetical protein KBP30_00305 [Streptomyces sp. Go40/10]
MLTYVRDPSHIPEILVSAATDWLRPLASRVLPFPDTGTYRATGSFLAHGFAYLPLQAPDAYTIYLRVSDTRAITRWQLHAPATVLTVAGTAALEMYRDPADVQSGHPQCARTLGAGEFFAAYPGAVYTTRATGSTVQVLAGARDRPRRDAVRGGVLRVRPEGPLLPRTGLAYTGGCIVLISEVSWPDAVPPMDMDDLRTFERVSRMVLNRLADDRKLLTQLVNDVLQDPDSLVASRITLLLNRLSLYQAPDRGSEIRLNMNPWPDNQRVPCAVRVVRVWPGRRGTTSSRSPAQATLWGCVPSGTASVPISRAAAARPRCPWLPDHS